MHAPTARATAPAVRRPEKNLAELPNVASAGVPKTRPAEPLVSGIVIVTPDMARHLRSTAHFPRQRIISRANVERLAAEMAEGRFTQGTQIYICVLPDGSEYVVNGNHTLESVALCGLPQPLTITRKAVADENEAGRIYAVFDTQKVRSWRDSLRAVGVSDSHPLVERAVAAIRIIDRKFAHQGHGFDRSRLTHIDNLRDYQAALEMFAGAIEGAPSNSAGCVKRAAIMAVALETFLHQPSLATEFWGGVAQDDGLTGAMPERALLTWLRNNRSGGYSQQREHCRAAALAWNAKFRGEERTYVKPNSMAAFFLLGTPFDKGLNGADA